ncbi:MAG: hypothetical protein HWN81_00125 [Candidatus Lokiarchaeota archaeon]|nr:hypothetical protein [Candidatus Lokiarchaeota archaeon]
MLKFTIDTDNAYYRIRSEMRRNIIDTYEENSTKLHPLKTKVGKWLNESNFLENSDTEVVIYNLWKYIQENKGDDFHMNNAFKIMEVLYTKYSDKYETPNARRRRMRRW